MNIIILKKWNIMEIYGVTEISIDKYCPFIHSYEKSTFGEILILASELRVACI